MSLNIYNDGETGDNNKYIKRLDNEEQLVNNNYFPTYQVAINNKITGTLKTGQVQYTYRFYHKYGISSKLAPLTSKIQVTFRKLYFTLFLLLAAIAFFLSRYSSYSVS